MKLYSKTQLLLAAIGAAVLAAAFAVFIDRNLSSFASLAFSRTHEENLSSEKIDFNNRTEENAPPLFEENSTSPARPVADTSRFTESEQQNIGVYDRCAESVVNISTKIAGINWFLEPTVEDGGTGSGSIIDKRGYIVTNVHVIQNASEIYVSLSDGTQYEAEIVGQDSESDLAVIKFTPPAGTVLKTISFGDSSKLKVGQKVIAIGNPFGLDRTMTTGIVSGLARPVRNSNNRIIRNMIQTDAAINPGNSGGPLLDTAGRMVGINTMIVSSSGSSAGVGFAIPAETAVRVVSDLIRYGRVNRGVVQMSIVQLNRTIVQYAGLDVSSGVLVSEVTKNGNADKAGIRGGTQRANYGRSIIFLGGDIVTKIDDIAVASLADYFSALEDKRPGDTVSMTIRRKGKDAVINVTLAPPQATN